MSERRRGQDKRGMKIWDRSRWGSCTVIESKKALGRSGV